MNVKDISNFLQIKNFATSKKMGQNFLINNNIKKKIVDSANIHQKEVILEIGPGAGAITSILLTYKIQLIAFELDKRLTDLLNQKFNGYKNFHLFNVDALKINWDEKIMMFSDKPIKLVANLPYSISSLLLLKILKSNYVNEAIVMVQKEMAERLVAKVATHSYNAFSVLIQLFFRIEKLFDVDRNNFSPKPKVSSSVIKLYKISNLNNNILFNVQKIDSFLKLSFKNKRKTLVNNLSIKYDKDKIITILNKMSFSLTIRAEEIRPIDLVHILEEIENA